MTKKLYFIAQNKQILNLQKTCIIAKPTSIHRDRKYSQIGILHHLIDYKSKNMDKCFQESSQEIKQLPSSSQLRDLQADDQDNMKNQAKRNRAISLSDSEYSNWDGIERSNEVDESEKEEKQCIEGMNEEQREGISCQKRKVFDVDKFIRSKEEELDEEASEEEESQNPITLQKGEKQLSCLPTKSKMLQKKSILSKGQRFKNKIKSYSRGVFTFVSEQKYTFEDQFKAHGFIYNHELPKITKLRDKINTIPELRNLWLEKSMGNLMRVVYNHFLRKRAYYFIYNTKQLCNSSTMDYLECRQVLLRAIKRPCNFTDLQ